MKLNNIFVGLLLLLIFYTLFKNCNKNFEMLDNSDNTDKTDNSDNKLMNSELSKNQNNDFQRYLDFKNKSYKDDGGYNGSNYMSDDEEDNNNDE